MSTPPMQKYDACVYFARVGEYVKIGYSYHPEQRMVTLLNTKRLICPVDLARWQRPELLHVIPDCRIRDERIIQGLFAAHHAVGEWFHLTLPFLNQLANLRYQTDRARARYAFLYRAEMKKARTRARAA